MESDPRKYNVSDATSRAVKISIPESLLSGMPLEEFVTYREPFDTNQPRSRAFVIRKLLSDDECDALIEATEKIGFDTADDIKFEYPQSHRNNQRMIVINPMLANSLWTRLQRFLTTDDVFDVAPVGFLANGMAIVLDLFVFIR
jgi:signal recognition particle subunit SEC65